MILITTSYFSDLDGLACIYAYQEFLQNKGIEAKGRIFGGWDKETQFIIDKLNIEFENKDFDYDKAVLVDESSNEKVNDEDVIEIIDHHEFNYAKNCPNANVQIEKIGAAATLIAEKFFKENIIPSNAKHSTPVFRSG